MKAVILGLAPSARLVDVTHEIEPQDIAEAAFTLAAVAPRFPAGTIHVAVVDPGVGTDRRGLVLTAGRQLFVGPDNGLFTPILRTSGWTAHELTAPELRLTTVSATFHGRDVFSPAAAYLALGVEPGRFGAPVHDPVMLPWLTPRVTPRGLAATVLHVDRFGNLITSADSAALASVGGSGEVVVGIRGRRLRLVRTFGDLPPGGVGALIGARGWLEVVVRDGNAARRLGAGRGTPVVVSRTRVRPRSTRRRRSSR
jgi:S-adenosylmethionine hydrolase